MDYSGILYSIRFTIIFLSCVLSFVIRLFPNIVAEPIIHEFDPHFNWRCTQYADEHGLYEFLNWYDNISWYPQGRPVGETSYPGMMFTSAIIKWTLQRLHIIIDIKDVCIYAGPIFSVFTTLVAFLFGQLFDEIEFEDHIEGINGQSKNKSKIGISSLGCMFAALISFLPGLISRSVAGSYDYECISLFILISCIYTFCYALKNGSILASLISAFFYGYMSLIRSRLWLYVINLGWLCFYLKLYSTFYNGPYFIRTIFMAFIHYLQRLEYCRIPPISFNTFYFR